MNFHHIRQHFAGGQDIVHAVVPLRTSVANIGRMKLRRTSARLINPNFCLLRQLVKVFASWVAVSENIFN